jgi:hypothetical protein
MSRRRRGKEFQTCKRCGRSLSDPDSRVRGYGPTCFGKVPAAVFAQLEEAGQLRFPGIK